MVKSIKGLFYLGNKTIVIYLFFRLLAVCTSFFPQKGFKTKYWLAYNSTNTLRSKEYSQLSNINTLESIIKHFKDTKNIKYIAFLSPV